jgi:hypothetical protein
LHEPCDTLAKDREKEVFTEYQKLFGTEFASKLNLFKQMEIYINGRPSPYPSARNSSGVLYPPGKGPADIVNKEQDIQTSSSDLSLRPDKRQEPTEVSKNSLLPKNFVSWLIGLLSMMVGVIAVFFFLRSRKPST